jgi:transposase
VVGLTEKVDIISMYFNQGMTKTQIAKKTGKCDKTVRKYIRQHEENLRKLDENHSEETLQKVINQIAEAPKYDTSNRKKRKLTDEIIKEIENCLLKNKEKISKGRRKQIMKAIDIHEYLTSMNYEISYSTVCNYIREKENLKEAFIKQEYDLGKTLEFDWGQVKLDIKGKPLNIELGVFTTACGSYHYGHLYRNQKMENFLDIHTNAISQHDGIYGEIVYDNMKQAVKKFVGKTEKEATDDLKKISLYYGFNYRFCNIASGNEKGHVERGVEFIRRKAFSFKDSFDSLKEANEYLKLRIDELNCRERDWLNGKTPLDVLNEERKFLMPVKPKYDVSRRIELRVNKYSVINIDQNYYSVPDHLVGKFVIAKIFPEKIKLYFKDNLIAEHERCYEVHKWKIDIYHYSNTLKKKPGAIENSIAKSQMEPRLHKIYNTYYTQNPKEFVYLLELINEKDFESVLNAIKKLSKIKPSLVTTDNIRAAIDAEDVTEIKDTDAKEEIFEASHSLIKSINNMFKPEVEVH